MDMKKLIQQMTDLESKSGQLTESEMPYPTSLGSPETDMGQPGAPLSVNVSMTASGKEHVSDLLSLMKNAGLNDAAPVAQDNIPMRQDIDRLRGIVNTGDTMHDEPDETPCDSASVESDEEILDDYSNEPETSYQDHNYMTKDLSGGLNREKDSYPAAQDGDNPIKADIRKQLEDRLKEVMSSDLSEGGIEPGAIVDYLGHEAKVLRIDGDDAYIKVAGQGGSMAVNTSELKMPSKFKLGDVVMHRGNKAKIVKTFDDGGYKIKYLNGAGAAEVEDDEIEVAEGTKGYSKKSSKRTDELSPDALRRYKDKAQADASAKHKDLRTRVKPHQQPQGDDAELDRKAKDRRDQVSKATNKIVKKDPSKPRKVSSKHGLGGVGPVDRYV